MKRELELEWHQGVHNIYVWEGEGEDAEGREIAETYDAEVAQHIVELHNRSLFTGKKASEE